MVRANGTEGIWPWLVRALCIVTVAILAVYDLNSVKESIPWWVYGIIVGVGIGAKAEDFEQYWPRKK